MWLGSPMVSSAAVVSPAGLVTIECTLMVDVAPEGWPLYYVVAGEVAISCMGMTIAMDACIVVIASHNGNAVCIIGSRAATDSERIVVCEFWLSFSVVSSSEIFDGCCPGGSFVSPAIRIHG